MFDQSKVDRTPVGSLLEKKVADGESEYLYTQSHIITYNGEKVIEVVVGEYAGCPSKAYVPVDEYIKSVHALHGEVLVAITNAEYEDLYELYQKKHITAPQEIDRETYWYFLEILAPCRWSTVINVESFHVSSRIFGDIVSWYCKYDDKFYTFDDEATLCKIELYEKLKAFIKSNQNTKV